MMPINNTSSRSGIILNPINLFAVFGPFDSSGAVLTRLFLFMVTIQYLNFSSIYNHLTSYQL
jgi:hypothetical protein